MAAMRAVVKSVISGDTLVLRGRPGPQNQLPKERILHLVDITAPRLGTASREDEPWAFESREFLRTLVVGKEVQFTSIHALPPGTDDIQRDLGSAEILLPPSPPATSPSDVPRSATPNPQGGNPVDLASELLRSGWVKTKEQKRDATEEDLKKKELENEARTGSKGLWNPQGPKARQVVYTMPEDSQAYITEWRGKSLDAVVEQVRDGSTVRVRLLMPDGDHHFVNIALAGVRCPRLGSKPGEASEEFAEEAKFFTESRLLQRAVRVQLLSLPAPAATPFQNTQNGSAPAPASIFIGNVLHPAGNVAEHLVANGYARVVDWHAGMLAAGGGMERLRGAERAAKAKNVNLYAGSARPAGGAAGPADSKTNGSSHGQVGRTFEAVVVRVWSGDQISVIPKDGGKERRITLSSTRSPRTNEPKQAYYAAEAKEVLRRRLIGKTVKVHIDFIRPKEGDFDERECATVRYGSGNINVAEQLIEKGLATALRHKRDDEDRSSDYDKLMSAEQTAVTEAVGLHSGKEVSTPKAPMNVSESASRANSHLSGFKRLGKFPGVVEYVASGSRFKILLPKDNQTFTLVLGGIRAPRSGRNPSDKGEPFGAEALDFSTRRYMQRDVEVEIESVDKNGGFIGALYVNKTENAAVALVKEGLGTVHDYSAENLSWAKTLYDAQKEAQNSKLNLWKDYDAEAEAEAAEQEQSQTDDVQALKPEYQDVIISDVRTSTGLSFSVQILNTEGIASLEKLMQDFSLHYRASAAPANFVPRNGDLVSAKFSDGSWYRAKVRRASPQKKEAEVTFIDYGNQDTVSFKDLRPLDARFKSLPGQAHDARLSFVKLVDPSSEYYNEAVDRFRALCDSKKLVANVDYREGSILHLRLMDPTDSEAAHDPLSCINVDLVREGLAVLDRKGCKYSPAYPTVIKKLQDATTSAKRDRLGMFEFGDVEED